jgi:hypothetical protein
VKTSLPLINAPSSSPRQKLLKLDGSVELKLSEGAESLVIEPMADGTLVIVEKRRSLAPEPPASPETPDPEDEPEEPEEPPATYEESFDHDDDGAEEEVMAAVETYAYGSISYPSTATSTTTAVFTHQSHKSVSASGATLYSSFMATVEKHPDAPMLGTLSPSSAPAYSSYSEISQQASLLASHLSHHDLVPPTPDGLRLLGIFMPNCPSWVVSELAAYSCSAATVPLYSSLGPEAIKHVLRETRMKTVACTAKEAGVLSRLKEDDPDLPFTALIVCSPLESDPPANLTVHLLSTLLSAPPPETHPPTPPTPDSLASICYTSGTCPPSLTAQAKHEQNGSWLRRFGCGPLSTMRHAQARGRVPQTRWPWRGSCTEKQHTRRRERTLKVVSLFTL